MIEVVEIIESPDEEKQKHLKGYMYDSLVYRYIRAREHMAEWEWTKEGKNGLSRDFYAQGARRDIMRFCQILDEAIGEHD